MNSRSWEGHCLELVLQLSQPLLSVYSSVLDSLGPSPSCSTHWAQQAVNARGYSQPSAPQIFLMEFWLHKLMTSPSFCCKPVHIYLSPASLTVSMCDGPAGTSGTLFPYTVHCWCHLSLVQSKLQPSVL